MTAEQDIVERLSDLARFYLNEKPDVPLSQEEREEIASELSSAAAEITRLRKTLAEVKEQEERWRTGVTSSNEAMMAIAASIRGLE